MNTPLFKMRELKALALGCVVLGAVLPVSGKVQEGVDTLVNFTGKNGAQPQSIVEDSAGDFYGTTLNGGKFNKGTVFEVHRAVRWSPWSPSTARMAPPRKRIFCWRRMAACMGRLSAAELRTRARCSGLRPTENFTR